MASNLHRTPDSLYNSTVNVIVANYTKVRRDIRTFPEDVQFDVYYKLYKQGRLCQLGEEFCELEVFEKILRVCNKRDLLHQCFQSLMDHGVKVTEVLCSAYCQRSSLIQPNNQKELDKAIQLGFELAAFFSDAGWFVETEKILVVCQQMCSYFEDIKHLKMLLECYIRLLRVRNVYCKFREAEETYVEAQRLVRKLEDMGYEASCLAGLYSEFCALYFVKSQYDEAYSWSLECLKHITLPSSVKMLIDTLRQASKACVVKRSFKKAEILIKQAVNLAEEHLGCQHPKFGDTLLDYGFYLLNVDCIQQAVQVYQRALDVRLTVFGGNNLHVAVAHEDLAYALYVHEYSSGRFTIAKEHAEKAMDIMSMLLPKDHLLLASSKRVKALILEEIAIDSRDKSIEKKLLEESQALHVSALDLAIRAFGEQNVQTAKHYGNLGRLYQSMQRFQDAEKMHKKAIKIKEELLGLDDYEVALSVGHLASLYNYDMGKFHEAELLYLRSIAIGKSLFGESYSGLEYDYRGLLKVYNMTGNHRKAADYTIVLHQWRLLRDQQVQRQNCPFLKNVRPRPLKEVVEEFFTQQSSS